MSCRGIESRFTVSIAKKDRVVVVVVNNHVVGSYYSLRTGVIVTKVEHVGDALFIMTDDGYVVAMSLGGRMHLKKGPFVQVCSVSSCHKLCWVCVRGDGEWVVVTCNSDPNTVKWSNNHENDKTFVPVHTDTNHIMNIIP